MKATTNKTAHVAAEPRERVVMTDADVERLERMLRGAAGKIGEAYARALRGEIARASVVRQREVPGDVVTMRSRVKVRDARTRKAETYVLVYPWESGETEGGVSVLAPVGTALLGMRVGDVVSLRVPGGERALEVEAVVYQPEAAGRYEL